LNTAGDHQKNSRPKGGGDEEDKKFNVAHVYFADASRTAAEVLEITK
jgi:hypothetical protein